MGSYRKGLLLTLGPLRAAVDLDAVAPAQRSTLKRLCPEHHLQLHQRYECDEGPHLVSAYVTGQPQPEGGWKIVEPDSKPKVEAAKVLELTPVPAQELESNTFEGESVYYCKPSSVGDQLNWELFRRSLTTKVAFVARGAMRSGSSEKLWRLETFRDYLVLREIVFPETIRPTPEIVEMKIDRETGTLVRSFIDSKLTEWDEFDSANVLQQRIDEWIGQGTDVETAESETPTPAEAVNSLKDALRKATG